VLPEILEPYRVRAWPFLIVEVDEVVSVEDVVGVPREVHAPVDALAARTDVHPAVAPAYVQAVEGGVEQHRFAVADVPCHVHEAIIRFKHVAEGGGGHRPPRVEKARPQLCRHCETRAWGDAQV